MLHRSALTAWFALLLLVLACAPSAPAPALGSEQNPIRMAIVPFIETQQLVKGMELLSAELKKETGLTYTGDVPTSYAAAVEAQCAGRVHVGWLSPLPYLLANKKCGVTMELVSVSSSGTSYRGMIIARADANIRSLQELKGKRFAWVDPGSTSGYLYPRALLLENGIDPDTAFSQQIFAGGHDKVVIAVMSGQVDAGAISDDFRQRPNVLQLYPRVLEETVVVQKTADIPNDGVAFNKDLPRELVDRTKQGLLAISNRPEGKKFFTDTIGTLGVAPTTDAAYDPVRKAASVLKLDVEAEIAKGKK